MPRLSWSAILVAGLASLASCGSGTTAEVAQRPFRLLSASPSGELRLNHVLRLVFSRAVDPTTASFNTIRFETRDARSGRTLREPVVATFAVSGHVVEVRPRLPARAPWTDGGFRPGRVYRVTVDTGVRDRTGRRLDAAARFELRTPSGTTPRELFHDYAPDPPSVASVWTPNFAHMPLSRLSRGPLEVRVRFDQQLDPSPDNVPLAQELDPRRGALRDKGNVFLTYDDPELGSERWIPTDVELVSNERTDAVLVLRPDGVGWRRRQLRDHRRPGLTSA